MRSKILSLALWAAFAGTAASEVVRATVPGKKVQISLDLSSFKSHGVQTVAGKTLLFGEIYPGPANISVIVEPNVPFHSSADWRNLGAGGKGFKAFEVGEIACCEVSANDPLPMLVFHAFPVTEEFCFDIHVSAISLGGKGLEKGKAFSRNDFLKIVKSFKVTGGAAKPLPTYPKEFAAFRDEAGKHGPDPLPWIEEQCKQRPDDYIPHLFLGEMGFMKQDKEMVIRGDLRAAELLQKKESLTSDEKYALGMAEDGLAWAYHQSEKESDALIHAQKAYEIAGELQMKPVRGERAYNLACIFAKLSNPADAAKFLKEAIAIDSKYKQGAKKDPDFEKVKGSPEFKKVVGP